MPTRIGSEGINSRCGKHLKVAVLRNARSENRNLVTAYR